MASNKCHKTCQSFRDLIFVRCFSFGEESPYLEEKGDGRRFQLRSVRRSKKILSYDYFYLLSTAILDWLGQRA